MKFQKKHQSINQLYIPSPSTLFPTLTHSFSHFQKYILKNEKNFSDIRMNGSIKIKIKIIIQFM